MVMSTENESLVLGRAERFSPRYRTNGGMVIPYNVALLRGLTGAMGVSGESRILKRQWNLREQLPESTNLSDCLRFEYVIESFISIF